MAHLSEDAALIEAFRIHHDFHAETAARVFGVDAAEVSPEQRAKIKAMNYGLAYGLSAFGLSNQLRISTEEARGLMDDYFETFGGVRDYLRSVVDSGPQGRLHRDHHGPPPLPARPHQRQPAAPRDGRADGAQRPHPGQRGRHHQGRDARRAPGAARPRACAAACSCRCTTSWCWRSPRASARRRGAGPPGDGRGGRAVGAAGGLGRATGAAGTTPRTDPSRSYSTPLLCGRPDSALVCRTSAVGWSTAWGWRCAGPIRCRGGRAGSWSPARQGRGRPPWPPSWGSARGAAHRARQPPARTGVGAARRVRRRCHCAAGDSGVGDGVAVPADARGDAPSGGARVFLDLPFRVVASRLLRRTLARRIRRTRCGTATANRRCARCSPIPSTSCDWGGPGT